MPQLRDPLPCPVPKHETCSRQSPRDLAFFGEQHGVVGTSCRNRVCRRSSSPDRSPVLGRNVGTARTLDGGIGGISIAASQLTQMHKIWRSLGNRWDQKHTSGIELVTQSWSINLNYLTPGIRPKTGCQSDRPRRYWIAYGLFRNKMLSTEHD